MKQKSINVPLSDQEFDALYTESQRNLRHPRDEARHILRRILLGEQPRSKMNNGDAPTYQGQRVAISA